MANKKRDRNGYKKQLGRYRLGRKDIIAIEKILRIYADAREMHFARISSLPKSKRHMPRKFVDCHISIGRYSPYHITMGWGEFGIHYPGVDYIFTADSVKFLPKSIKKSRYIEVACKPGISISFRPLSTTIYAQTHYATGKELKVMKEVIKLAEEYFSKLPKSTFNLCRFD